MSTIHERAVFTVFNAMRAVLGAEAQQTTVSVAGGMYMQHRNLRRTNVSGSYMLPTGPPYINTT